MRGGEGGGEMVCGDAVDGYIVERLHIGGGDAHGGCTGAVDRRVGIVRRGRGLRGVGVLRVLRMGMGVLETKGVGEGVWGGEIVVLGGTGAVWDKEAAHGVSAARNDDGVWARRGTGAGNVRDGVGTAVAAGGSRRTDGRCPGTRARTMGRRWGVAILECGGRIWVWLIAHGGVECGEGGVEVGIVVLVDVVMVLLLSRGRGRDVKDVVPIRIIIGGARVGRSLMGGDVGCLDEVGELVCKVDRLLLVGGVVRVGLRGEPS